MTKLVVFDLDGVLTDAQSSWCWVHDHYGVNNDESLRAYMDGEIDDMEFMRRDIELWRNQKRINIKEIEDILLGVPLMPGARETLHELNKKGLTTAIISGGLEPLAKRVAEELHITHIRANHVEVDDEGYLTGVGILKVPLLDKGSVLVQLLADLGIEKNECVSVGNSEIDVPLFHNSGLGIAFNCYDEKVKENADVVIHNKDLREILPHVFH